MQGDSAVRLSATSEYQPAPTGAAAAPSSTGADSPSPARPPSTSDAPKPACRIRRAEGSGFSSELESQLHSRLRLATMILASGYFAVGVRSLIFETAWLRTSDHLLIFFMTLLMAGMAAMLWQKHVLSMCWLRRLELVIFGSVVLHFCWIDVRVLEDLTSTVLIGTRNEILGWRLGNVDNNLRWFVLIVIYGVFIPNTGRRCALYVTAMAALHVGLTLGVGLIFDRLGLFLTALTPDTVIFLGLGVAIAVFGSAKIAALQEEAFVSRRLGQYQLKQRLGIGGMGEVYLAEHLLLRRPCVVKLIRPDRRDESTAQARFEREVKTTATLTHWNTVAIFDYGHTVDGTFYYVMEYLPGLTLQELVARHAAMPPGRVVHVLRQVCAALHEAHGIGLIHRDIKPSNIMLCPLGGLHDVAKLLDFGLVQSHSLAERGSEGKLTREGYIVGTPDFMSPEQAQDSELIDARSDIYSLGAVAYYLLTGSPPFVRKTAMQVVVAHAHEQVPPLCAKHPDVPPELEAVVLRCLEKRPERRWADARALEQALAEVADRVPWTEEQAEAWWQQRPLPTLADEAHAPTLLTAAAR
ncbi:MAG TPA: serine/threonine-protein kinase [Gemmatales bacterium]|nr:serine/threonine-protein kinase [Gemmatales bacterium]HMP61150.1 serine/threonine-protein kinase [Gemmatales bacterium]